MSLLNDHFFDVKSARVCALEREREREREVCGVFLIFQRSETHLHMRIHEARGWRRR